MIQLILGMIFTCFCYPAFELLITYLQQKCQYECTKIAAKTYEIKKKISDDQQQKQYIERVPAIGFKMPDDPEYYPDDDQEEQDD